MCVQLTVCAGAILKRKVSRGGEPCDQNPPNNKDDVQTAIVFYSPQVNDGGEMDAVLVGVCNTTER